MSISPSRKLPAGFLLVYLAVVFGFSSAAGAEVGEVIADLRVAKTLTPLVAEYNRICGTSFVLRILSAEDLAARRAQAPAGSLAAVAIASRADEMPPAGGRTVAWTPKDGLPIHAIPLCNDANAAKFVDFCGGPWGHQFWSWDGYRIGPGNNAAEVHDWVSEHRVKHTYPMTAARMMAELGGIREGICIDVGCGSGQLEIELARVSGFKIIGLDIDPDAKPLFEKRIKEAGLQDRASFVVGDAQKMPFPDKYADVIVSRGTLTFIPDIAKCLREVERVMKPDGVAFLGGRYLYTPRKYLVTDEKLAEIVAGCGVKGAKVVTDGGQWVKIVGPEAPEAAVTFQGGPQLLAGRMVADYRITEGNCLLICPGDGGPEQALQDGLLKVTRLKITALYPNETVAAAARERIAKAGHAERITCKGGAIDAVPAEDGAFDLIAGVGPTLIFQKDKAKAMRELRRVLAEGGAALVGGRFLHMPPGRKVSSDTLRKVAADAGIPGVRVIDDMGQWVEIRKGVTPAGPRE